MKSQEILCIQFTVPDPSSFFFHFSATTLSFSSLVMLYTKSCRDSHAVTSFKPSNVAQWEFRNLKILQKRAEIHHIIDGAESDACSRETPGSKQDFGRVEHAELSMLILMKPPSKTLAAFLMVQMCFHHIHDMPSDCNRISNTEIMT